MIDVGSVILAQPLHRLIVEGDAVPVQRRRDLQGNILLGSLGVVAQREFAGNRHDVGGAVDLDFELIAGDGEGPAIDGVRQRTEE